MKNGDRVVEESTGRPALVVAQNYDRATGRAWQVEIQYTDRGEAEWGNIAWVHPTRLSRS